MELIRLTYSLRKWWWLIILATVLAGGSSYWNSSRVPKTYLTSTTIQVGQFIESTDPRLGDLTTSQQLAQVYAQAVRREPVLQATIDALGLPMGWETLAAQVNAFAPANTQLIQISAVDIDPVRAKAIADEVAEQLILQSPATQPKEQEYRQFIELQLATLEKRITDAEKMVEDLDSQVLAETSAVRIRDIQGRAAALQQSISGWQASYSTLLDVYSGGRTNYLSVVGSAPIPTNPIGPNIRLAVLLGASIGFLLALGAALLMDYLDDTLRTADDVTRVLGVPTLGSVSKTGQMRSPGDALMGMLEPDSAASQAFCLIRTSIRFAAGDKLPMVLLVTSPGLGEGKSTTAASLALSLSQSGRRVVLVDTDLRYPSIHHLFGVSNHAGLTSLLANESFAPLRPEHGEEADIVKLENMQVERYLMGGGVEGLRLLVAGPPPQINPGDLLGSSQMQKVLYLLRNMADVVILDCPPAMLLADAAILASMGARAVLVVEAQKTRSQAARIAKETLLRGHSQILGVVLNKVPRTGLDYYRYRYSHEESTNVHVWQRLIRRAFGRGRPKSTLNEGI